MLEGQCLSWAGPISAAVYLPTDPLDEPEGQKPPQSQSVSATKNDVKENTAS